MALSTVGEDLSFITVSTHDIPTSNLAYHILLLEDGDRYMTTNTIDLLFFHIPHHLSCWSGGGLAWRRGGGAPPVGVVEAVVGAKQGQGRLASNWSMELAD
jgi:hypothetical protein